MLSKHTDIEHYENGFRFVVLDSNGRTVAYTNTQTEALSEAKRVGGSACALQNTGRPFRRNPPPNTRQMNKPPSAFYGEVRKYGYGDEWQPAWWREALQNAIDAVRGQIREGIRTDKTIELNSSLDDNTKEWTVSCLDHGGGMTSQVFYDAFFTLGGTAKPAGSVGGFGEAKLLLLCPWLRWSVRSQDYEITGSADACSEPQPRPYIDGTKLTAVMQKGLYYEGHYPLWTHVDKARKILEKSYLPDITIKLNGEVVPANKAPGPVLAGPAYFDVELRDEAGNYKETVKAGYTIHYKEPSEKAKQDAEWSLSRFKILYRIGGLYMFETDAPKGVHADLCIEFIGHSKYLLNPNRTKVENTAVAKSIDAFITKLIVDPGTVLYGNLGKGSREIFTGSGRFTAEEDLAQAKAHAGTIWSNGPTPKEVEDDTPPPPRKLTEEERREIAEQAELRRQKEAARKEEERRQQEEEDQRRRERGEEPEDKPVEKEMDAASPEIAVEISKVNVQTKAQLEAMLMQLAWRPDYLLENLLLRRQDQLVDDMGWDYVYGEAGGKGWKTPKEFHPKTMSRRVQRLLVVWTELCRFVLVQLGCSRKYGVGFVFSHKVSGLTIGVRNDDCWILLNPYKDRAVNPGMEGQPGGGFTKLFNPDDPADLKHMYAVAIHECTHVEGYSGHNESFSSAMTLNIAQCADGWRSVYKIAKLATGAEQRVDVATEGAEEIAKQGERAWDKMLAAGDDSPEAVQAELARIRAQLAAAKAEKKRVEGKAGKYKARGVPRELGRLEPWPEVSHIWGKANKRTIAEGKRLVSEITERFDAEENAGTEYGDKPYQHYNLYYDETRRALRRLESELADQSVTERTLRRAISKLRVLRDSMDPPPYRQDELGVQRPWPQVADPANTSVTDETRKAGKRLIDEIKAWHPRSYNEYSDDGENELDWNVRDKLSNVETYCGLEDRGAGGTEAEARQAISALRLARDKDAPRTDGVTIEDSAYLQEEIKHLEDQLRYAREDSNRRFNEVYNLEEQLREVKAREQKTIAEMQQKIQQAAEEAMAKARAEAEESYQRMLRAAEQQPAGPIEPVRPLTRQSSQQPPMQIRQSGAKLKPTLAPQFAGAVIVWQAPVLQNGEYVYVGKVGVTEVCRFIWSQARGTRLVTSQGERPCKNVAEAKALAQSLLKSGQL